nr:probable E3 ubiquitin-protein ligase TRIML1 isoform X3 [Zonotrichia albicollis]
MVEAETDLRWIDSAFSQLKDLGSGREDSEGAMAFFLKPRPCTWDLPLDYHTAKQFEVDVTLDPATVGPEVVLSEDLKEATWGRPRCQWPEGPGRFDTDPCMLGSKGFTSGRHYWEVEANGRFWAVGVARESVQRKGRVLFKPNTEIWGLQKYDELCVALTAPSHTSVPLLNGEIGVYLDYEVKGENKDQFQMQCCPSQILSHCYLKFKKKCTFCGRGNTNQHLKNEKHGLTGEIEEHGNKSVTNSTSQNISETLPVRLKLRHSPAKAMAVMSRAVKSTASITWQATRASGFISMP